MRPTTQFAEGEAAVPGVTLHPVSEAGFRFRPLLSEYAAEARTRYGQFVVSLLKPLAQGLAMGRFEGYVAQAGRRAAGAVVYASYHGIARISFLHVSHNWRNQGVEELLLDTALSDLAGPGSLPPERILSEPMVVSHRDTDSLFAARGFAVIPRRIMRATLVPQPVRLGSTAPGGGPVTSDGRLFAMRGWQAGDLQWVTEVLRRANQNSVDRDVYPELLYSDQALGAVRGVVGGSCGRFDRRATGIAGAYGGGAPFGVLLCSRCRPGQAFIVEVAVDPAWQGRGVGTALIARTLEMLARSRVTDVSLGVTESNTAAVRLYERAGFRPEGRFSSYLWLGEEAGNDVYRPA
jgi:ribosomal protein S18 acetylase RimI-like enzyme